MNSNGLQLLPSHLCPVWHTKCQQRWHLGHSGPRVAGLYAIYFRYRPCRLCRVDCRQCQLLCTAHLLLEELAGVWQLFIIAWTCGGKWLLCLELKVHQHLSKAAEWDWPHQRWILSYSARKREWECVSVSLVWFHMTNENLGKTSPCHE